MPWKLAWLRWIAGVLLLPLLGGPPVHANDFALRVADRTATERVYYAHRLGTKLPFEQALPALQIERLVRLDLQKEAALKQVYGMEVTPAMLEAEVQRITTTTRAPEVLAEIKMVLDNDPKRFARTIAAPILVERLLRHKFNNDDDLHSSQRRNIEKVREQLLALRRDRAGAAPISSTQSSPLDPQSNSLNFDLAATNDSAFQLVALLKRAHSNEVSETTWQLAARPAETNGPGAEEIEILKRFGENARILSASEADGRSRRYYFEDLPIELQNVLRVQLGRPGDVSAVIEMPDGFLLYVLKEKTDTVLSVAGLSLPKRSFQQWLNDQNEINP